MARYLRVTQKRSAIRRQERQKRTIRALGIHRLHESVEHRDSPQIRGMIEKVRHLVEVEEIEKEG
ncbi:MAG: 50S ribosomal protein L30 [Candidatus Eisenbacteria sp.]|nr:50S ribosomal protein L30 [Candidatus Eisenbacteria bacterium]